MVVYCLEIVDAGGKLGAHLSPSRNQWGKPQQVPVTII